MAKEIDSKSPKIRFKGFKDAWEEKSLGELCEPLSYGLNAPSMKFDGANKYLRITDIDEETRSFRQTDITSPNKDLSISTNYVLEPGDVVFARTGASVGKTYLYKKEDGRVFFAGFLIRARTKTNVDEGFVFQNTLLSKYKAFVKLTSQRSGQPGINAQEYSSYSMNSPCPDEQIKIGGYFRTLDSLIELHQRKHEKLVTLKKAMLQKMFPQPGATIPEIRFKGFSGEWEEMTLEDVLLPHPFKPYIADSFSSGPFEVIQQGDNPVAGYASGMPFQEFEDVILFGDHTLSLYRPTKPFFVASDGIKILGNRIGLFRDYLYSLLVAYMPPTEGYKRHLSILKAVRLPISLDQTEQRKIGTYFRTLDELIAKHAIQLQKFKQIKSAYLEKMFV